MAALAGVERMEADDIAETVFIVRVPAGPSTRSSSGRLNRT
jgi:hypothetical protein